MAYHEACSRANRLINSWNRHPDTDVSAFSVGRDSRRVWSAVLDLLHIGNVSDSQSLTTDNDNVFCSSLATFFVNKVHNIKTAIMAALSEHDPNPLSADLPNDGPCFRL